MAEVEAVTTMVQAAAKKLGEWQIWSCLAAGRSGLAWEHSIEVGGGVVDADKNPVFVILFNHSDIDFEVKVGDRIAQLVIELNGIPEIMEVHPWSVT